MSTGLSTFGAPVARHGVDDTGNFRMPKLTYSVVELQSVLGLGRTKIFALLKSGALVRVKIGRRTLITATKLAGLLPGYSAGSHPTAPTEPRWLSF